MNTSVCSFPALPADLPHGDMPGDKIRVTPEHEAKAQKIWPLLKEKLDAEPDRRFVIAVCGGSGVGKSEIASVLAWYLEQDGIGTYVLSGDNYPRRVPRDNDAERLRVYRCGGLKGLVARGLATESVNRELQALWASETDAGPAEAAEQAWLRVYRKAGRGALTGYLGTTNEIDFDELSGILSDFHRGAKTLWLKRMGRVPEDLWYDEVPVENKRVLIVEWTHGNSDALEGIDLPILLNSTPAETLAHRRARNRDGKTDSAFTAMVLEIEQQKLESQAHKAWLILSKQGELLSYASYRDLMAKA